MKQSTEAALAVVRDTGLPVFPVNPRTKRPALSNAQLGTALGRPIGRGEGGYKAASTDPEVVTALFEAASPSAAVAVPMGRASGLACVDADIYKSDAAQQWVADRRALLERTRCHRTQSGGLHYIFEHDPRLKSTVLSEGIDLKAEGGYILWPLQDGEGYQALNELPPLPFDFSLLPASAPRISSGQRNGNGSVADWVRTIETAGPGLHDAIRDYAAHQATRLNGPPGDLQTALTEDIQARLRVVPSGQRDDRWQARYEHVAVEVRTALERFHLGTRAAALGALLADEEPVFEAGEEPGDERPTVPQDDEFEVIELDEAYANPMERIQYIVPGLLPRASLLSVAGNSGVGKTRFVAMFSVALASGRTDKLGFESMDAPVNVLWFANEERRDDIKRRIRAAALQQGASTRAGHIVLRGGRDSGPLRLVVLDGTGQPIINHAAIDAVCETIRRYDITVMNADPYVTLGVGVDENSATATELINTAFNIIIGRTGVTIIHVHHTPKDRSKQADWYRGGNDAWRGSGAIYSALDAGLTLSPWIPMLATGGRGEGVPKATWELLKRKHGTKLNKWVVMDSGKVREGGEIDSAVFRMVSHAMPEGGEIGVMRQASEEAAMNFVWALIAEDLDDDEEGGSVVQFPGTDGEMEGRPSGES